MFVGQLVINSLVRSLHADFPVFNYLFSSEKHHNMEASDILSGQTNYQWFILPTHLADIMSSLFFFSSVFGFHHHLTKYLALNVLSALSYSQASH